MKNSIRFIITVFSFYFFANSTFAQDSSNGGSKNKLLVGAFTGRILPKGVPGASEIFPLSGVRVSYPLSETGFLDMGGIFGNGQGVLWKSAFVSLSMHIPVETLIGHAGLGLDLTRYESDTTPLKNIGGGHFIGGVMTQIGGNVLARFDMKLNSKPGTSLYFGLGIVIAMDWAGGGSGGGSE